MNVNSSKVLFLRWLSRAEPALYRRVMNDSRAKGLGTLGTLGSLGWVETVINAVAQVGSAILAKKQTDKQVSLQKKQLQDAQAERDAALKAQLLQVNYQRAQSGLPPVDMNGNPIPSQSLPVPTELTGAQVSKAVATDYLPWLIGAGSLVGVYFLAARR